MTRIKPIFFMSFLLFILVGCAEKEVTDSSANDQTVAETDTHDHEHDENHEHEHGHDHSHHHEDSDQQIYEGYFDEDQVKDRSLSDWEGDWQSVYPYLTNGTLDEVLENKAKENGEKTFDEYKEYYTVGYETEIDRIEIADEKMIFHHEDTTLSGTYEYDGLEILTYEAGNQGVRYLFNRVDGDQAAPRFVQFSDHHIYPTPSAHFHIYLGNESQEDLLEELTNWPTYYPSEMSGEEIVHEMIAH
ncbi:metal-binding protein ZinT [Cytobacillus stercorigallinarum]|nr:metal-binding protein ZinT [Cytobacillus stercorigallinarum]